MLSSFYYFFWREKYAFKDKFLEQVYFIQEVPFALFGKFLWERVKVYKKCSISLLIRKPRPYPIYCNWTCCIYSVSVRGLKTYLCSSTSRPFWCEVFFNSSALFASWGNAVYSEGNEWLFLWDWNSLRKLLSSHKKDVLMFESFFSSRGCQ